MQHALSEWQIMVYIQYLYQMQSIICIFRIILRKKNQGRKQQQREKENSEGKT